MRIRPGEGLDELSSDGGLGLPHEQGVRRGGLRARTDPEPPRQSGRRARQCPCQRGVQKGRCRLCAPSDHQPAGLYRYHGTQIDGQQLDILPVAQVERSSSSGRAAAARGRPGRKLAASRESEERSRTLPCSMHPLGGSHTLLCRMNFLGPQRKILSFSLTGSLGPAYLRRQFRRGGSIPYSGGL